MGIHSTNVLALFAGACGLEIGIERAIHGSRLVCCVEREAYGAATIAARMESGDLDQAPIWSDVGTFDGIPWRGVVDLVSGGFPCQDVSVSGKGAGLDGERSGLWFEMARIIREVRPRYVVIENVSVLTIRGLDRVLVDLAESGFDAEWGTLRASDVGAPHQRDRVFVFAWDREMGNPEFARWKEPGAGHEEHTGREFKPGCWELANAAGDGRGEGGTESAGWDREPSFDIDGGSAMADFNGGRFHTREQLGCSLRRRDTEALGAGTQSWPPKPGNIEEWRAYIDGGGPEPGICRSANGLANRLDRLRLTGNGVVPQQAAAALVELIRRAGSN